MKIGIDNLILDTEIYPRIEKSPKTIEDYVEKLRSGVQFPPIEVQQVQTNGEVKITILDGYHRWQAHLMAHAQPELGEDGKNGDCLVAFDTNSISPFLKGGRGDFYRNGCQKQQKDFSQIDAVYWKEEILDKQANLNELRLRSIELNQNHGIRLDRSDYQMIAEKIAKDDYEHKYSAEDIAKRWSLKRRTVNEWVSNIRAAQKAKRDRIIYKLFMLGWTSLEIAKVIGISESRVRQSVNNGEIAKINASISDWLSQGKTVEEAAEKLEIDATLAWAVYLQGKSDEERAKELGINIKKYTVWNYTNAHPLMGSSQFEGRIPGEVVFNIIHYFSKPGDLVIDPMAGSGTTLDAALLLDRKCRGYDLKPTRDDIVKADTTKEIPYDKLADLIFVNPPYWRTVDYGEGLSACNLNAFFDSINALSRNCFSHLRKNGFLALMMGNQSTKIDESQQPTLNLIDPVKQGILEAGFTWYMDIWCPWPTQGAENWAQAKWDKGYLADLNRAIMVFRKAL